MNKLTLLPLLLVFLSACQREFVDLPQKFTEYSAKPGNYVFDPGTTYPVMGDTLSFEANFHSNTKYTSAELGGHSQVNKLFGFSDCSSINTQNSARFGWLFDENTNQMKVYSFRHVNGEMQYDVNHPMAIVELDQVYFYQIEIKNDHYVFTIKDHQNGNLIATEEGARGCTGDGHIKMTAIPYFGGTKPAPHEMEIDINIL